MRIHYWQFYPTFILFLSTNQLWKNNPGATVHPWPLPELWWPSPLQHPVHPAETYLRDGGGRESGGGAGWQSGENCGIPDTTREETGAWLLSFSLGFLNEEKMYIVVFFWYSGIIACMMFWFESSSHALGSVIFVASFLYHWWSASIKRRLVCSNRWLWFLSTSLLVIIFVIYCFYRPKTYTVVFLNDNFWKK